MATKHNFLPSTLSLEGATKLAKQIEDYWFNEGFIVETRLERMRLLDYSTHVVRSNIGHNGYPPQRLGGAPEPARVYRLPTAQY